ncbi:MAG TPA: ABC transporter permease [Firmicutes bacterium]|jgi:putative ABC transport system permease protein|nr:ABC transporter permease [Bacillota bacterium]
MWKIAWRNVLRNKRRSLLSAVIIVISVMVLSLVKGYITATYEGLEMMAVMEYGNLQIAKEGYWENTDNERHLLDKEEISKIGEILAENPAVISSSAELAVYGVMGTEKSSVVVSGKGIEPGSAQSQNILIVSGSNLFAGDVDRVLLGKGVKQKLGLDEEEWVSLLTTTLDGAYNAGNLQVTGAFSVGNPDADNAFIMLPLSYAQRMLNTDGVDKFVVSLAEVSQTEATISWLQERFKEEGIEVTIKSWLDLATFYHQVRSLYEIIFFFISIVLFIIVFFSILEIISMAFFERMSEIGSVRAIGAKRRQVFALLSLEGLFLSLIAGTLGVVGGWLAGYLINQGGITYTPPSISDPVPLYIDLALTNGLLPFILVVTATALSAFIPATKAARLNVVDVLRHL